MGHGRRQANVRPNDGKCGRCLAHGIPQPHTHTWLWRDVLHASLMPFGAHLVSSALVATQRQRQPLLHPRILPTLTYLARRFPLSIWIIIRRHSFASVLFLRPTKRSAVHNANISLRPIDTQRSGVAARQGRKKEQFFGWRNRRALNLGTAELSLSTTRRSPSLLTDKPDTFVRARFRMP